MAAVFSSYLYASSKLQLVEDEGHHHASRDNSLLNKMAAVEQTHHKHQQF